MTTIQYDFNAPADLIEKYGWTQGRLGHGDQPHCLHGAIRECSPVLGDSFLVSEVVKLRGKSVRWNDDKGRTKDEVLSFLRSAAPVTDDELAEVFGPQWREIVALVRRAATLTKSEAEELAAALDAALDAASDAAWNAARKAASDAASYAASYAALNAARDVAFYAAFYAARHAARHAAWHAVRDVALNAACALVVRDLIGTQGFTQNHYDTLTGPWRRVIGPVHPDDAAVEGGAA